ncbi:hypothetical protein K2173_018693 [Erythroxylum novogranatense]|uniref:Uncharacterized protein n=1 Tax=Erythroxylum novogranatense TaxID=1862640 RepID=A0AAV8SB00_9ROSI|nr:hypothetical protein K2173_018693 [Erythroxylum novogranatense]
MALNLSSASLCHIASSATPQFLILKNKIYPSSSCKLFVQAESREGGVTEQGPPPPSSGSLSSTRTQLDLLEQLTSTSDVYESSGSSSILTIRDQLAELGRGRDDDFSIPLGKNLKKVSPKFLTVSQKRNIKRQAYLDDVSQRNDSVFFATIGAFVILPPFIILGIAIITGYVQLFP